LEREQKKRRKIKKERRETRVLVPRANAGGVQRQ